MRWLLLLSSMGPVFFGWAYVQSRQPVLGLVALRALEPGAFARPTIRALTTTIRIAEARWPDDRATVEALFREYVASLAEDISFQNVDDELAGLPGKYARPGGVVLIARDGASRPARSRTACSSRASAR